MKINRIDRQEKIINIILEDLSSVEVTEEDYLAMNLYERVELSNEEIEFISRNRKIKNARIDAIKFVSYKIRACREVFQRLEKLGYEAGVIETTIESLKKDKYLDDLDYARRYARTKIKLNKISRKQLKLELSQKGIRDDYISQIYELDDIDEHEDIKRILEKKYTKDELRDSKKKLKAMKFLYSKGYSIELIQGTIDEITYDE